MFRTTAMVHLTNRRQALAALQRAETRGFYTKTAILVALGLGMVSFIGTSEPETALHRQLPSKTSWKVTKKSGDTKGNLGHIKTRYLCIEDGAIHMKTTFIKTIKQRFLITNMKKIEFVEDAIVFQNDDGKKWYKFIFDTKEECRDFLGNIVFAECEKEGVETWITECIQLIVDDYEKSADRKNLHRGPSKYCLNKVLNGKRKEILSTIFQTHLKGAVDAIHKKRPAYDPESELCSSKHLAIDKDHLEHAIKIFEVIRDEALPADGLPGWLQFLCKEWYRITDGKNFKDEENIAIQKVGDQIFLRGVNAFLLDNKPGNRSHPGYFSHFKVVRILQKAMSLKENDTTAATTYEKVHQGLYTTDKYKKLVTDAKAYFMEIIAHANKSKTVTVVS